MPETNPTSITGKLFFFFVVVVVTLTLRIEEKKKLAGYWHFSLQREQKTKEMERALLHVLELWGNCDSLPLCTRTLLSPSSFSPAFWSFHCELKVITFFSSIVQIQGFAIDQCWDAIMKITDEVIAKALIIQDLMKIRLAFMDLQICFLHNDFLSLFGSWSENFGNGID